MLPLGSEQIDKKYLVPYLLPAQQLKIRRIRSIHRHGIDTTAVHLIPQSGDACHASRSLPQTTVPVFRKTLGWNVCANDQLSYIQALIEIDDGVLHGNETPEK